MFGHIAKFFAGAWHPYTYKDTRASQLGKGVSDLALERPNTLLRSGFAGPRYNVRGTLEPQSPGYVKMQQDYVPVALVGNGQGFFTGIALQQLSNPPRVQQG